MRVLWSHLIVLIAPVAKLGPGPDKSVVIVFDIQSKFGLSVLSIAVGNRLPCQQYFLTPIYPASPHGQVHISAHAFATGEI